jgi:hypothetical protein
MSRIFLRFCSGSFVPHVALGELAGFESRARCRGPQSDFVQETSQARAQRVKAENELV